MCGIAGVVARRNSLDVSRAIKEMSYRVRHRGPDDHGHYVRGRVALGHRRLSIIDLSVGGHQPMASEDGRYVIVYNGEVYNFLELKSELMAFGFRFRSNSDTEVVLAAFAAWGSDCLARFNGMWSFAIYDEQENSIFAARDRFGVKPFYFILNESCFAFGSEIRQLLPLLDSVEANPSTLSEFLLVGEPRQSPETFFKDVSNLLPGHYLSYHVDTNRCSIERYYGLSDQLNGVDDRPDTEVLRDFREIFEDSVRLRLRSDVRVGTCLSGGLDSSSVAMVASAMHRLNSNSPFSAITAISDEPRNSEEIYAEAVIDAGSLHWIKVRPSYEDFCASLDTVVTHQEEPFASPSICMQSFVMRAARENGVVVLLDGQGGDETLLGYDRYYIPYFVELWRAGDFGELLHGVRDTLQSNANMNMLRLTGYLLFGLLPSLRHRYHLYRSKHIVSSPPRPDWINSFAKACHDVRALQILEVEATSLPSLLRYEDKNSMAFSIEARLPFLDYRLVEKSIALALNMKMRAGWTKWALRQSMSDVLPHRIAWRRNKIGFAPPDQWIARHGEIMAEKVVQSVLMRRFCDLDRLRRYYSKLDPNSQWRLYSVALWEEQFGVGA